MTDDADTPIPPLTLAVNLGHAIDGARPQSTSATEDALLIAQGRITLLPRSANDNAAVERAERILAVPSRPIYAYIGDLHPNLGQVGLIFSPSWLTRCGQGVSRCDSGGLAGQRGHFCHVLDRDVESALRQLSFNAVDSIEWAAAFDEEVRVSYPEGFVGYVNGVRPDSSSWNDIRKHCINQARGDLDRRLWTWEARLAAGPDPAEVCCIVLSPEARKELEDLRRRGVSPPPGARLLAGYATPMGVHHFREDVVRRALRGDV